MAYYDASQVRAVAIELKEKVLTLYTSILPIVTTSTAWTLNGLDPTLPQPFPVRVQLEAYDAITKEVLRLKEWIASLKEAQPSDSLTYPTPPGWLIVFNNICFEELQF